jgi:hypothetical protein
MAAKEPLHHEARRGGGETADRSLRAKDGHEEAFGSRITTTSKVAKQPTGVFAPRMAVKKPSHRG